MNPIEKLAGRVKANFTSAKCDLDAPANPMGSWFLDVCVDSYALVVEWKSAGTFGLTAGRVGVFGEGADETYPDYGSAVRRVLWLLEHRVKTAPSLSDQLRSIRAKRQLTQEEMAKRLDVQQSSVSKLEGRGETVSLRKLQEFIAAMGGQLSLRISFPDSGEEEKIELGQLHTGA